MEDEDPFRHFDDSKAEERRMLTRALETDIRKFTRGRRRQAYFELGAGVAIVTIVIWLLVNY